MGRVQGPATITGSQDTTVKQSHKDSLDTTLTQNNNNVFVYYIILSLCNNCIMQGQHTYQELLAYHTDVFLHHISSFWLPLSFEYVTCQVPCSFIFGPMFKVILLKNWLTLFKRGYVLSALSYDQKGQSKKYEMLFKL